MASPHPHSHSHPHPATTDFTQTQMQGHREKRTGNDAGPWHPIVQKKSIDAMLINTGPSNDFTVRHARHVPTFQCVNKGYADNDAGPWHAMVQKKSIDTMLINTWTPSGFILSPLLL